MLKKVLISFCLLFSYNIVAMEKETVEEETVLAITELPAGLKLVIHDGQVYREISKKEQALGYMQRLQKETSLRRAIHPFYPGKVKIEYENE